MLEILKKLCQVNSVSGNDAVTGLICDMAKPYATDIYKDNLGNLICFKKGIDCGKKIMVATHHDEVGFIVKSITSDGFIKFDAVGGIDPRILPSSNVVLEKNDVAGVIGQKAVHLQSDKDRKKAAEISQLYIDIGADTKKDAESLVTKGDYAAFESEYILFGKNRIKAKALDDRAGCAIMIELIKQKLKYDTVFVFTVGEEVGLRGAIPAAFAVKAHVAIIAETTTAADFGQTKGHNRVCGLGNGAVVPFMDGGSYYDKELYNMAGSIAKEKNIKIQTKTCIAGGNDSAALQRSGIGAKVLAVSVPVRNIHTMSTVADMDDIRDCYRLIKELIEKEF